MKLAMLLDYKYPKMLYLALPPRLNVQKLDFQSEFSMSKNIQIFLKKIFIEEYDFRVTLFVIKIFWKLQFLNHLFSKWHPIFDDFYSTVHKTWKLFMGLVVGFGPKGMPGRMCDIAHFQLVNIFKDCYMSHDLL